VEVSLDEWGRPLSVVESDVSTGERENGRTGDATTSRAPVGREGSGSGDPPGIGQQSGEAPVEKRVEALVEEWRIDDEWWRTPIHRRYFEIVLEGGAHVVLFEDLGSGEWFMQKP
jgi:hypothetical protein